MKKIILSLVLGCGATAAFAQQDSFKVKSLDQILPRLCIDVNYKGGVLSQSAANMNLANYTGYNANTVYGNTVLTPTFKSGSSNGGDISLGYFFGENKMFGIGVGFSYFAQTGSVGIGNYEVQYSQNAANYPGTGLTGQFAQLVTSNQAVSENLNITNMNIPLMVKFKHRFNRYIGINADLGGTWNLSTANAYSTNGIFNYEAAYKLPPTGGSNSTYDAASIITNPASANINDWLITRSNYVVHNGDGGVTNYFNQKQAAGYNVGLNMAPSKNSGTVNYNSGYGFFGQAALSYQISYNLAFNLGAYYSYQVMNNTNVESNWMLTKTVSNNTVDYNSIVKGVDKTTFQSYGINIGIRYYIGGIPDVDGDGVPDAEDDCPNQPGPKTSLYGNLKGCPDKDFDGFPDKFDMCPDKAGVASAQGCPDEDGDGIADDQDKCPHVAGLRKYEGCPEPDRDDDGVPDAFDKCPDVPGPADNFGCPLDSIVVSPSIKEKYKEEMKNGGGGVSSGNEYIPPHIVLSTTVLNFKFGKAELDKATLVKLDDAVEKLKANDKLILSISGYTDDVGSFTNNLVLSYERAKFIGEYMVKHGIDKKRIILSGYGKENPIIPNSNSENRAKNRRIEMKLMLPI
jgi:outer membrane protein OmpA-like peptidoglycan-associated protein